MNKHYILNKKNEIKQIAIWKDDIFDPDLFAKWAKWFFNFRQIALDTFGDKTVSTIFLGIDHSIFSEVPTLFETAIITNISDDERKFDIQARYRTYRQAIEGHQQYFQKLQKKTPGKGVGIFDECL